MAFVVEVIEGVASQGIMETTVFLVQKLREGTTSDADAFTDDKSDDNVDQNGGYNLNWYTGASLMQRGTGGDFSVYFRGAFLGYLFLRAFVVSALIEEMSKYLAFTLTLHHPDFWSQKELQSTIEAIKRDEGFVDEATFLAAHATNPYGHDRSLKSRCATILVTMVSLGLGFSCCETLLYVIFYSDNSPELEIAVLIARAFLPIHPICSAWQGIGVCRRELENKSNFQMGRVVLPAVIYHGTFDFLLTLVGVLDFEQLALGLVSSFSVALGITLLGITIVTCEFHAQQRRLERQSWIDLGTARIG
eukprot:CAMPEP_0116831334 /NCGR_PEP_ID=MMETSP0418-20121206/5278_1 /TAXON_ID=1158023 /ORGANISM="Astrosyne radiata, Strain 13vi08-1A" /LENGTH=304 /DNA_ID=CAMNT_0004460571 /DNA_START=118 /DNA_END=1033 /DNA_ORIENTATION=-